MSKTQVITYVIKRACSTQEQVQGALIAFFCDLKEIIDEYIEGHIEGVGKRNERRFQESMARYKAMEDEAEQELKELRQRSH
jgi:hypothetical protein